MLTVLTQMTAFISANRSDRLPHIGRRALATTSTCRWLHSSTAVEGIIEGLPVVVGSPPFMAAPSRQLAIAQTH